MRVFGIKLGDEPMFEIDIIEEVGAKKPLTKFIDLEIKNGILYVESIPALNAFDFSAKIIHLRFEKIKSNPKVEMIVLLKGSLSCNRCPI